MALESGAVVIPCAMVNTDIIQPPGRLIPKLRPRPGVRFGKPLDFSRYEGMSGDRFVERSMTDEIMYELMQLSGQEYVDQYAAKVKAAAGQGHRLRQPRARRRRPRARRPRTRTPGPPYGTGRALLLRLRVHRGRPHDRAGVDRRRRRGPAVSSTRCPPSSTRRRAIDWVRRNVLDKLPAPADPAWRSRERIRDDLLAFLTEPGEPIELWAWMSAYDHVVLVPALGRHAGAAPGDPALHPRTAPALGGRRLARRCRPRPPDQHDALADARHNLARWRR